MRRVLLALLGIVLLLEGVFGLAWIATPGADDVQARIAGFATEHHARLLSPGEVPPLLAEAIVATEDERFHIHHGLDSTGIARAVLYDVSHLCACQGGSTITQQVAKLVYLDSSDAGFNKVEGMALAVKIEQHLSKADILAGYLSIVPTGPTRYGMAAAACAYYGRPLTQLDLPALAMLAGLPQAPSSYDPLLDPAAAVARRAQVLAAMRAEGDITEAQQQAADSAPYRAPAAHSC